MGWYRVVGWGASGAPRESAEEAWDAIFQKYHISEDKVGSFIAAHNLRLAEATTRRAVMDADISVSHGRKGRGEWWVK